MCAPRQDTGDMWELILACCGSLIFQIYLIYFWLICRSVAYPSQYCSLRLAEMLPLYNFLWSLLFVTPLRTCSTPYPVIPSSSGATSFHSLSCPGGPSTTVELGWGVGAPQAKMPPTATAVTQGSVGLFECILLDLLYAFGWFPFLKWLLLTDLSSSFHCLSRRSFAKLLICYSRSSVPFPHAAFLYLFSPTS